MVEVKFSAASHKGNIRANNEDCIFINGNIPGPNSLDEGVFVSEKTVKECLLCVFDGMGGESYGEIASRLAAETLLKYNAMNAFEDVEQYVNCANDIICRQMQLLKADMGTTMALISIKDDEILLANIGDSRVLRIRNNEIIQLSEDHTRIQSMLSAGIITPEDLERITIKNYLTQYLGMPDNDVIIKPYCKKDSILKGDIIIISSDGLTDMISNDKIKKIATVGRNSEEVVKTLIREALRDGGKDNISVIVIFC